MPRTSSAIVAAAVLLTIAACTGPTPPPAPTASPSPIAAPIDDVFTPVLALVEDAPIPAPSTDGRVHLAYELTLTNAMSQSADLQRIQVMGNGESLLDLAGDDLLPWLNVFGGTPGSSEVGGGQRALVWIDLVVDTLADAPSRLEHIVTVGFQQEILPIITSTRVETVAGTAVAAQTPVVVGAPLEGSGWLDGNGCCAVTPHRAALNPINGDLHVPERFAIDYVQVDEDGRWFDGDVTQLDSYGYHGANILAVADGPVVAMVTDQPEQVPGANPTGLTLAQYGGNYVVQQIGDGRFAFYAHLQPNNPLGIEVGQVLERGDVLGLLGNTGNTDSPHLHFHVMDSPSPLASNGLPFLIDSFDYEGSVVSESNLIASFASGRVDVDATGAGPRTNESPLYLSVMTYPQR